MSQIEGYIYKLVSDKTDKIYIGSTIKNLTTRLYYHYKNKDKDNTSSKELLIHDDVRIELIEPFLYNDVKELRQKEREYISKNKDICVNVRCKTINEKERAAEWREKNREKTREYDRQLRLQKRELNPLPPPLTDEEKKQKKKEYHALHKKEKSEYDKQYREAKKDILNEDNTCECGGKYKTHHKASHLKTKKHLEYIKV
jgi:hypothetical protein